MKIRTIECASCGSNNIKFDAVAKWNPFLSQFDLEDTLDSCWCENCSELRNERGDPHWVTKDV